MLTYIQKTELRTKLLANEISLLEAQELFWRGVSNKTRSWHTKDWQERSKQFKKDCCEGCGSKERLTLQHTFHPDPYREYRNKVIRNLEKVDSIEKNILINHIKEKYTYNPVAICPKCNIWNPNERVRKLPRYLCTNCRHEFDDPIYKSISELVEMHYNNGLSTFFDIKCFTSNDRYQNKLNINGIIYFFKKNISEETNSEYIERTTFLNYLDDDIRYLSFKDTVTLCNRCAYNYDIKGMELCPECKSNYKRLNYPTCIQCLPEERRKQVEEQFAFNKEMTERFHKLDII